MAHHIAMASLAGVPTIVFVGQPPMSGTWGPGPAQILTQGSTGAWFNDGVLPGSVSNHDPLPPLTSVVGLSNMFITLGTDRNLYYSTPTSGKSTAWGTLLQVPMGPITGQVIDFGAAWMNGPSLLLAVLSTDGFVYTSTFSDSNGWSSPSKIPNSNVAEDPPPPVTPPATVVGVTNVVVDGFCQTVVLCVGPLQPNPGGLYGWLATETYLGAEGEEEVEWVPISVQRTPGGSPTQSPSSLAVPSTPNNDNAEVILLYPYTPNDAFSSQVLGPVMAYYPETSTSPEGFPVLEWYASPALCASPPSPSPPSPSFFSTVAVGAGVDGTLETVGLGQLGGQNAYPYFLWQAFSELSLWSTQVTKPQLLLNAAAYAPQLAAGIEHQNNLGWPALTLAQPTNPGIQVPPPDAIDLAMGMGYGTNGQPCLLVSYITHNVQADGATCAIYLNQQDATGVWSLVPGALVTLSGVSG